MREKVRSGQRSRSFRVGHYHSEIAEGGIVHGEGEGNITKENPYVKFLTAAINFFHRLDLDIG